MTHPGHVRFGPVADRTRATVAVFDLDGTLTRRDTFLQYLLRYLAHYPHRMPRCWHLPTDVIAYSLRLRDNSWLKRRFLEALLGGVPDGELGRWTERFVDEIVTRGMRPEVVDTLRAHQAAGHRTVLLSASPDLFVRQIASRLDFSDCVCTRVARDTNGRLTGELDGGNCHGPEKVRRIEALLRRERAALHVVAYADHASDLPLLRWADEGVLVHPPRALRRIAAETGIRVLR